MQSRLGVPQVRRGLGLNPYKSTRFILCLGASASSNCLREAEVIDSTCGATTQGGEDCAEAIQCSKSWRIARGGNLNRVLGKRSGSEQHN